MKREIAYPDIRPGQTIEIITYTSDGAESHRVTGKVWRTGEGLVYWGAGAAASPGDAPGGAFRKVFLVSQPQPNEPLGLGAVVRIYADDDKTKIRGDKTKIRGTYIHVLNGSPGARMWVTGGGHAQVNWDHILEEARLHGATISVISEGITL